MYWKETNVAFCSGSHSLLFYINLMAPRVSITHMWTKQISWFLKHAMILSFAILSIKPRSNKILWVIKKKSLKTFIGHLEPTETTTKRLWLVQKKSWKLKITNTKIWNTFSECWKIENNVLTFHFSDKRFFHWKSDGI